MEKIKLIRKGDGSAYQNNLGQFVFVKNGVNFALSFKEMRQMEGLFKGLQNGALMQIDPNSGDWVKGD